MTRMTAAELDAFLHREFPQVDRQGYRVEEVRDRFARVRLPFHEDHLRPGGTVSGPALMSLADTAMCSDGDPEMVAHATLTYSIPDKR
jgi:acyl-coenzyme A thioesterase PaaI-like protein